jgi:hypothetical protein
MMRKGLRSAIVTFTACFAMAAGAQSTVTVGKDGSVKVHSGDTKVDVGDGKVNVQTQGASTEVSADGDEASSANTAASDSGIVITGSSRKETIACNGNTRVSISGSENELTFTGECKKVAVTGSMNKVSLDTVDKISVTGSSNTVTWKQASSGNKKPKVAVLGQDNKVSQAK